ncbi:hypothetical protein AXF23_11925 [Prevotella sp. oral taxon 313]|uniref:hypothetical protein n=1 Tax=Prevotella sp. oral taxon 313 TaxID=652722 RepID=UPI000D1ED483|nr:hypothetical protein [Prevotella sp. oral taxon 313]PTL31698.1 hypothetical protein AXF23_11925 [Prevotella sp. oral taxon 313]
MMVTEIKQLFAEELTLLKKIQKYGKEQPQGKQERVEKVKLLLLYRIYSNLYSSLLLTAQVLKTGKISFFQLPIGLLLRCCFTDCLFTLYIQRAGKKRAYEELNLRTIEYANSMLERQEVYRDQVKSTGKILDDVFIDHLWELTMEDSFLEQLTFDDNLEELTVIKQSKQQLKYEGFSRVKSVMTKDVANFLIRIPELEKVATRLYHYYKYFSQYEHFSENGQGDVLAALEKDGNDNIHLPSAIKSLSVGVEIVMNKRGK